MHGCTGCPSGKVLRFTQPSNWQQRLAAGESAAGQCQDQLTCPAGSSLTQPYGDGTYGECVPNVCSCQNGTPADGAACTSSGTLCTACVAGYGLSGDTCVACTGGTYSANNDNQPCSPCPNINVSVDTCDSQTGNAETCRAGYILQGGACVTCADSDQAVTNG